jgi:hypothetical protein
VRKFVDWYLDYYDNQSNNVARERSEPGLAIRADGEIVA